MNGHCNDCQWWTAPDESKGPWGMCTRSSAPGCLYTLTEIQPFLFTLPTFRCEHHEAK
jgi:hypothetical protein